MLDSQFKKIENIIIITLLMWIIEQNLPHCKSFTLPNRELSVLYGGPLPIMGDNYSCMFPIYSA